MSIIYLNFKGRRAEIQIIAHRILGPSTASRIGLMSFKGDDIQKLNCEVPK